MSYLSAPAWLASTPAEIVSRSATPVSIIFWYCTRSPGVMGSSASGRTAPPPVSSDSIR